MKVKSQLVDAQIESRGSNPTKRGEIVVNTADSNQVKYHDGSSVRTVANTDQAQTFSNKTHTDPVLNGTLSGTGILDEDNMASDSDTAVPTQQSVKAYVDSQVATHDEADEISYDNATSGLTATDVQAAIDEVDGDLDTHIADTSAHGVSGDVVGTTDTQDLSNKTFTDSVTLEEKSSTPSNPASGDKKLYAKDDGKLYTLDSSGNEIEVGSGSGSGSKNYIDSDSSTMVTSVGSWTTDNGAGSAASTITLSRNTTTPLSGDGDLSFAKSAADGNGEYAKLTTQAIDRSDRGKTLYFSCEIDADDSNYANNLEFEFYDNTNSAVLYAGLSEDLSILKTQGKFTTAVYLESTTAEIEVRIKINDTDATAYTVYFDDFKLGPAAQVQSPVVGEWKDITVSSVGYTGSLTTESCVGRRVGDSLEIVYLAIKDGTAASGTTQFALTLSGYTIDTSKLPSTTAYRAEIGSAQYSGSFEASTVTVASNTLVVRNLSNATLNSGDWGAGQRLGFHAKVPIEGWTSGATVTENELALQTVRVRGSNTSGGAVSTSTPFSWTEVEDTHGAWNGTEFTALKRGPVSFSGSVLLSSSSTLTIRAYVDGTYVKAINQGNAAGTLHTFSGGIFLEKGEVLSLRPGASVTQSANAQGNWIDIVSHPDYTVLGVVESPKVYIEGRGNGGATLVASTTDIDWTEVVDTHGAWDGDSFTAPFTGTFSANGMVSISPTSTMELRSYIDGTLDRGVIFNGSSQTRHEFAWKGRLTKGEVLTFRSTGTQTLFNSTSLHWITIISE